MSQWGSSTGRSTKPGMRVMGSYTRLPKDSQDVIRIRNAWIDSFYMVTTNDKFAADSLALESTIQDDGGLGRDDIMAGLQHMQAGDEGKSGEFPHPINIGIATISMCSTKAARVPGREKPNASHTRRPKALNEQAALGITKITVFCALPFTDGRLWYIEEMSIRAASAGIRKKMRGWGASGDMYVMASLPGTLHGSPVVRPRALHVSDIEGVCSTWDARFDTVPERGYDVDHAMRDAIEYGNALEAELGEGDETAATPGDVLTPNMLWAYMNNIYRDLGLVNTEKHERVRTVEQFCKVEPRREVAREKKYEAGKAARRMGDDEKIFSEVGFVQDASMVFEDFASRYGRTKIPYYASVISSKTDVPIVAIRVNELRMWIMHRYVSGLAMVFSTVIACNSMRGSPKTAVVGNKCRVRVPSRFLIGLGLPEMRVLWAICFAPISLSRFIFEASGDAVAEFRDGLARPQEEENDLYELDPERALALCKYGVEDKPWALKIRDVIYAVSRLVMDADDVHIGLQASFQEDRMIPLAIPLRADRYKAFFVLQSSRVIDWTFANTEMSMLSLMPPLNSTKLDLLRSFHDDTRCVYTCAFGRVAVFNTDAMGVPEPYDREDAKRHARMLFSERAMGYLGERLVDRVMDDIVLIKSPRSTPLVASAIYDYVISLHGAPEESLASKTSLYDVQAWGELAESRMLHARKKYESRDKTKREDATRAIRNVYDDVMEDVPDSVVSALATWVAPAGTLPPEFTSQPTPLFYKDTMVPSARLLPAMKDEDLRSTTARITLKAVTSVFVPPSQVVKDLEYGTTGSTGVYLSAAVDLMKDKPGVFGGSWGSVGAVSSGGVAFRWAVNWLIAIGAVVPTFVPRIVYENSDNHLHPPIREYAEKWRNEPSLGLGLMPDSDTNLPEDSLGTGEKLPFRPARQNETEPEPVASTSKAKGFADSDSDSDMDWGAFCGGSDDDAGQAHEYEMEEAPTPPPPLAELADVDPVISSTVVAKRSQCIAENLAAIEAGALKRGRQLPVHVENRVQFYIYNNRFPPDLLADRMMKKRVAKRNELVEMGVIDESACDEHGVGPFTARPDLDINVELSDDQKEVLEGLLDPDRPCVHVMKGRAGTGKSLLMLIFAMAFGLSNLAEVVFLANMNVNVQALQNDLGFNSRVSTAASYMLRRGKIMDGPYAKYFSEVAKGKAKMTTKTKKKRKRGDPGKDEPKAELLPLGVTDPDAVRVVCIEEAGNISDQRLQMLAAIRRDFPNLQRLIFFGDPDQLDPIQSGAPYQALIEDHNRANLSHVLTEVHHTEEALLLHTALMITNGAASPDFVRLIKSQCKLTGPGITTRISTDPSNFTLPVVLHTDPDHGFFVVEPDTNVELKGKALEDDFISRVVEVMRSLDSEFVVALSHRKVERDLLNKALRTLRSDIGHVMLDNYTAPKIVSGDTAMPLTRVGGMLAKNSRVVVLGFLSPTPNDLFDPRRYSDGESMALSTEGTGGSTFVQAAHKCANKTRCIVVVRMEDFFAAMQEFVTELEAKNKDRKKAFPDTDVRNSQKYLQGHFVPVFSDFERLKRYPKVKAPFVDLVRRRMGSARIHILKYNPEQWTLGYASTGAAAQGCRFPYVICGITRPSKFFNWKLLNVMITRARHKFVIVSGFKGVLGFFAKVIRNRKIKRTNILPAYLPTLAAGPPPLALPPVSDEDMRLAGPSSSAGGESLLLDIESDTGSDREAKKQKTLLLQE